MARSNNIDIQTFINESIKKANENQRGGSGRGLKKAISDNRIAVLGGHRKPLVIK